jgi:FAD/FMN-containing dehydrogenase
VTVSEPSLTITRAAIKDEAVAELRTSLRGLLLRPGDNGYETARHVWNGMIDKHPALIARCTGVADVIAAIQFARTHDLLVAVRGGGHNVAGNAVCDGGLVIDLSMMKGIRVDPAARTVRAEGGVTWGDLDHETQAFGLATTGGLISTTGIAGFTLGGGFG